MSNHLSHDDQAPRVGHDPIRKSHVESPSFNRAWLKDGTHLTWLQRIGFAIISFAFLSVGLLGLVLALGSLLHEDRILEGFFEVCLAIAATVVLLLPGAIGLRNVLRFPKSGTKE